MTDIEMTPEQEKAQRVAEALREGIVAERLYEPDVAAALLGVRSKRGGKSLTDIPEELLPVTRIGPQGGLKRYYGRNLIAYIHASGPVLELAEVA